jgi:prepilin-type N-terminal cleavage/methylation domain-containing protein
MNNMIKCKSGNQGFSLLEMLLVLVIASSLIVMFLNFTTQQYKQQNRDKTVMQAQQILNAALSYYTQNGRWPGTTGTPTMLSNLNKNHELIANSYLPPNQNNAATGGWISPFGATPVSFYTYVDTTTGNFYLFTDIIAPPAKASELSAIANTIAGQLPSGYVTGSAVAAPPIPIASVCGATQCEVVTSVPPPGQNLNNARSVNFGSLYKSGQCVPVPSCPTNMTPQIFAVPVQVSGSFDNTGAANPPVYPVSSYTAYATAPAASPASCTSSSINAVCSSSTVTGGVNDTYWRVCLSITTQKGLVQPASSQDNINMGTIMAITRCVPTNEPTGSSNFNVYN